MISFANYHLRALPRGNQDQRLQQLEQLDHMEDERLHLHLHEDMIILKDQHLHLHEELLT